MKLQGLKPGAFEIWVNCIQRVLPQALVGLHLVVAHHGTAPRALPRTEAEAAAAAVAAGPEASVEGASDARAEGTAVRAEGLDAAV